MFKPERLARHDDAESQGMLTWEAQQPTTARRYLIMPTLCRESPSTTCMFHGEQLILSLLRRHEEIARAAASNTSPAAALALILTETYESCSSGTCPSKRQHSWRRRRRSAAPATSTTPEVEYFTPEAKISGLPLLPLQPAHTMDHLRLQILSIPSKLLRMTRINYHDVEIVCWSA